MEVKEALEKIEEFYSLLPLWEKDLDNIIVLLKSLQAENNAYKEMWEEFRKSIKDLRFNNEYLLQEMKNLETKHLGGGE